MLYNENEVKIKEESKMHKSIRFESLAAVHTHTHTSILLDNKIEGKKEEARIVFYAFV